MTWAIRLYSGVIAVLAFVVGPLFALHGRGRRRLKERFGTWALELPEVVWFHGASLGEMNGLVPIMRRWRATFPEVPILVTATSTTGLDRAADVASVARLVPFDSLLFLRRALGGVRIRAFIFGETELWPGLIAELERRGVPRFMVNARIGARSVRWYRVCGWIFRPAFRALTQVFTVSLDDRRRLLEVGVLEDRCRVVGNAKYDLALAPLTPEQHERLTTFLSPARAPVIVLGSLRPGEEALWFPALSAYWDTPLSRANGAAGTTRDTPLTVVVAPRHPEKFEYFAAALRATGMPFRRRSDPLTRPPDKGLDIVLLDTLGELRHFYGFAALAFVGGSLVDWGGHNPLEPALVGVPTATGPATSTVTDIIAALDEAGGRIRLSDEASIAALIRRVVERDSNLAAIGKRGQTVARQFTGVADVVFERICTTLMAKGGGIGA